MKRNYTKDKTEQTNVMLSKKLKINFKVHCIKNGYIMADRIRFLIERDLTEAMK